MGERPVAQVEHFDVEGRVGAGPVDDPRGDPVGGSGGPGAADDDLQYQHGSLLVSGVVAGVGLVGGDGAEPAGLVILERLVDLLAAVLHVQSSRP
jgi:hypothetical protein